MTHIKSDNQETIYAQRQIVCRLGQAGSYTINGITYAIPEIITLYGGEAARFVRLASKDLHGFLRFDDLKFGQIVINPGLIYDKIPMTGKIMSAHLKSMAAFKPRIVMEYEKDDSPPVDLGVIH